MRRRKRGGEEEEKEGVEADNRLGDEGLEVELIQEEAEAISGVWSMKF